MVAVERRISSQLQKKATTSPEGQQALLVLTKNLEKQNKENTPAKTTLIPKRKSTSATSKTTAKGPLQKRGKLQASGVQKKKKACAHSAKAKQTAVLACNYGCAHGGLVTMQQMQPYDTKHYLGEGKYLHKKNCKDCKKSLAALFEHSKQKTVFYYCQVDYNLTELTDDDAKAETPCATILCIECYFARETKKNETAGTTRRSSARGRAWAYRYSNFYSSSTHITRSIPSIKHCGRDYNRR
jgi:hypothetical protein